jgi:hypothetical protein
MNNFRKFWPLIKVDEATHTVYGVVTAQRPDKDGEIMHYNSTVPYYKDLNEEFTKATDGKSIAPLREMHQLKAAGVGKSIDFRDPDTQIAMGFKVVDDDAWKKVKEGVYTGFSQGGAYVKTWRAPYTDPATNQTQEYTWYTAKPGEISLVDSPCLKEARFELVKADGTKEERTFKKAEVAAVNTLPPQTEGATRTAATVPPPYGQTPGTGVTTDSQGVAVPESKCDKCGMEFKGTGTMCPKCAAMQVKADRAARIAKAAEMTHEEKERLLRGAVTDKFSASVSASASASASADGGAIAPSGPYAYLRDFTDDYVIVDGGNGTFKVPYSVDADGNVSFGEPTKVRQTYTETGKGWAAEMSGIDFARVEALIEKARKHEPLFCAKCGGKLSDLDLATGTAACCKTAITDPANVLLDPAEGSAAVKAWQSLSAAKAEKKTKWVDGKDLTADNFAFVGDPDKTETWKYPVHDKDHAQNALARWGQHKGIPADEEPKVLGRIRAAAKKHGINVSDEAEKVIKAYRFLLEPDMKKAAQWAAADLAQVSDTIDLLKAAAAEEGDDPENVAAIISKSVGYMTTLLQAEVTELQEGAAAILAKKGDVMTEQELQKLQQEADELLAKARSAGDHLKALGAMHKAHMEKAIAMHKGHHDGCMTVLGKAMKAMGGAFDAAGSSASGGASIDVQGAGPSSDNPTVGGAQGAYPGGAHANNAKVTLEDVAKLVDERLAKAREDQNGDLMKMFVALYGEPAAPGTAAPGIGDRTQVVKTAAPVSQVVPAGPKAADTNAPQPTQPATATQQDVIDGLSKGDIAAKLRLAKTIREAPIPAHLMSGDSPAAGLIGGAR